MILPFAITAAVFVAVAPPDITSTTHNGTELRLDQVRGSASPEGPSEPVTSDAVTERWEYATSGYCARFDALDYGWGPDCLVDAPVMIECLAGPIEQQLAWGRRLEPQPADETWRFLGEVGCGADDAALLAAVEREWTSLTPEPSTVTLQPPGGVVFATVPTIAIAGKEARIHHATILDTPVTIEATPTEYTWDWGDGEQTTTTDPGAPYPQETVSHTYGHAIDAATVSLTTTWTGRWRTDHTTWQDFNTTVTSTSPTTPLEIRHPRAVLVE